ncbi:glycosyltransferase family 2 protein [bacterium]|nr:glycosyltransferase family 2 protein [bacterium]
MSKLLQCVFVMPAYNEQDCIELVVNRWLAEGKRLFGDQFRLVVVNDGSKDSTGAILDKVAQGNSMLVVVHQKNGGHGAALIAAYRKALSLGTEYVFHVDSDDQFIPADFPKLWEKRDDSKFILGNRSQRHDAFHRLVITRILKVFVALVFGVWIDDCNVPYRLIEARYLRQLLDGVPNTVFAPNIFLSILAAKQGQKTFGIPVTHEDRKTGQVSIIKWKLISVCLLSVRELIQFRLALSGLVKRINQMEYSLEASE